MDVLRDALDNIHTSVYGLALQMAATLGGADRRREEHGDGRPGRQVVEDRAGHKP